MHTLRQPIDESLATSRLCQDRPEGQIVPIARFGFNLVRVLIVYLSLILSAPAGAQEILFPGLDGAPLREAIKEHFRPAVTLNATQARDTLYAVIDIVEDSVEAIYSGHRIYLPPGVDPSQWVFMNGNGINLEHVYPQSLGAGPGTTGHTDMHHLFPARVVVNEARANFPFGENPDHLTTTWFRRDKSMSTIPTSRIDEYSESRNGVFEPRESVKGNIARAMLHFYTLYQEHADAADPDYFPAQRATLCQWHVDDPADEHERARSARVAIYQDGKENPFVIDCSLALRAWCPEFSGCTTSVTPAPPADRQFNMIALSPASGQIRVRVESTVTRQVIITIHTATGVQVVKNDLLLETGQTEWQPMQVFVPGVYMVRMLTGLPDQPQIVSKCVVW